MTKTKFRSAVRELLATEVVGLNVGEKVSIVRQLLNDHEMQQTGDESNKGRPWSDDELRVVLRSAPTKENCLRFARAFRRGYGSIEQIYRWAAEDRLDVERKRPDDKFIAQVKRVAKEVGWRAT